MLLCLAALCACGQVDVVSTTPAPSPSGAGLPPIGYSHRYGNSPVAARDGLTFERRLYATRVFWEVDLTTQPAVAGYVALGVQSLVTAGRHAMTSLTLVLATEERGTIAGLLNTGSHPGQEAYAISVLTALRGLGYDHLTSAQVQIFFSERDKHAQLTWSAKGGYSFAVFDDDLRGTSRLPALGGTPLPSPPTATPSVTPPPAPTATH